MENDFSQKKLSPFTAIGFLLAAAFLITRGPVLWLLKSVFGLAFLLLRPALIAFGTAKAWSLADQIITEKAKITSRGMEATPEMQTPVKSSQSL